MLIRSLPTTFVKRAAAAVGAVACALAAGTGAAHAQGVAAGIENPFAVKLGGFVPSSVDARRASSDVLFAAEVEYTIQSLFGSNRSSYTTVAIGYTKQEDLRIIPFTLNQIFKDPGNVSGVGYYYGGGIGLYSVDLDRPDTSGKTKTLFGLNAVAGIDLTKNWLIEAKYHYPFDYDNKFVGGFQIMAGYRF